MKKSRYKELEQLNREMNLPLESILNWIKYSAETPPKQQQNMPLYIMRNLIIVHNNRLKIKELLEEPEDVKTKYKDQKLFP